MVPKGSHDTVVICGGDNDILLQCLVQTDCSRLYVHQTKEGSGDDLWSIVALAKAISTSMNSSQTHDVLARRLDASFVCLLLGI